MNNHINLKYKDKRLGIYGLGQTGISVIKFLQQFTVQIYAWDDNIKNSKEIIAQFPNVTFNFHIKYWQSLDYIITSPGLPTNYPRRHSVYELAFKNKIPLLSDIDLLLEYKDIACSIAITGSNGKSSTVSLLEHIFKQNNKSSCVAGNIGKPVLDDSIVYSNISNCIFEISSFQLEILSKKTLFDVGAILNITPDHNERYATFEDYFNAKALLSQNIRKLLIINIDYPFSRELFTRLKKSCIKFELLAISLNEILYHGLSFINGLVYRDGTKVNLYIDSSKTKIHNENVLASFAICQYFKLHYSADYLYSFKGLPHRLEIVYQDDNITIINDSKATNTAATITALQNFSRIHWIAGGVFKENNLEPLVGFLHNIVHCYFIGQDSEKFVNVAKARSIPHTDCRDLSAALEAIKSNITNGTILLSPACASFDQWQNFMARGNEFKQLAIQKFNLF